MTEKQYSEDLTQTDFVLPESFVKVKIDRAAKEAVISIAPGHSIHLSFNDVCRLDGICHPCVVMPDSCEK